MYLKYNRKREIPFDKKIEIKSGNKENFYEFLGRNERIILEGKFYYYNRDSRTVFFRESPKKQLMSLLKEQDIVKFINNVEGEYCGIKINYRNRSLTIFSDKLKQSELYYFFNKGILVISENPREIISEVKELGYNKYSLMSAVLLHTPGGNSFFKKINRLKYNEVITIIKDKISLTGFKDKDIKITRYSKSNLRQYNRILTNAILSRASNNLNLVYSSGGWDSTMLLSILKKYLGKNRVGGIVLRIILPDGRCFNKFEVNKTKQIGKTLGIKMEVVDVDYREKEHYYSFDRVKEDLLFRDLLYLWPNKWTKVVEYISEKYGKDVVIFNGEGCDSLHNYGFSQYISLPSHDNDDFNEYADKMKNYLYGPDFFQKIKTNNFFNDTVYRTFLLFNQDKKFINVKNFNLKKRIYYYLLSFVLSDLRIPFRKIECKKYIKDSAIKKLEKWLEAKYFREAIENINEDNLYYYFSYLYASFHLQSPQIRIFRIGLNNVRFPFIDSNLFKFLYKMPQNFGRGLNFNRIKFPLKELAKEVFSKKIYKIIGSGPHSYLSEVEEINVFDEAFLRGPVYDYMKDTIDLREVKNTFRGDIFYTNEIESLIKRFKRGKLENISGIEVKLLMFLTLLSSYTLE